MIGSGKTILASINSILDYFKKNSINTSQFQLFFAGIYVNKSASSNITKYFKKLNIQVKPIYMELPQKLLKGDVIFDSKEYKHVIEVIKKYEKLIDSYQAKTSTKSFDMGFDKCKYAFISLLLFLVLRLLMEGLTCERRSNKGVCISEYSQKLHSVLLGVL